MRAWFLSGFRSGSRSRARASIQLACGGLRWGPLLRYLGTGKDLTGAALVLLAGSGFYGEAGLSPDDPYKRAHARFKGWCSEQGLASSCPLFTQKSCHAAHFGCYDGKAAQIKMMIFWLADEFALAVSSELCTDVEIQLAATCFWALAAWVHTLDHAGLLLTGAQVEACLHYGRVHLRTHKALALWAVQNKVRRWKVRPKMHYLDHTFREVSNGLNPRFFQCFLDEDFIGKVVSVAERCHRSTVAHNVLRRYMVLLDRRWRA